MHRNWPLFALVMALLSTGALTLYAANGELATGTIIHHHIDKQTVAFRSGVASADSNTIANVMTAATTHSPSWLFGSLGRDELAVSARFTAYNGEASVRYIYVYQDGSAVNHIQGVSPIMTFTATNIQDPDGLYMSESIRLTAKGSNYGAFLVTATVSTVTFCVGSE